MCPAAVATLPPKVAMASLVLTSVNYEGLTPAAKNGRPRVLLTELSEHCSCPRVQIVRGMAKLCTAYGGD
jgi:hypothetical protein